MVGFQHQLELKLENGPLAEAQKSRKGSLSGFDLSLRDISFRVVFYTTCRVAECY